MNAEEMKWRRRSDARTLAEAEHIKADKERYKEAIIGAKEIANEEIERVKGIAKVAGMRTPKSSKADFIGNQQTSVSTETQRFDRSGYRNPAVIGRL